MNIFQIELLSYEDRQLVADALARELAQGWPPPFVWTAEAFKMVRLAFSNGQRICTVSGCKDVHYARGKCARHYERERYQLRRRPSLRTVKNLPRLRSVS